MEQQKLEGRKVFFLYPHSVIQDAMVDELIMSGYEIYILRDHKRARTLIKRFPGSIMFINIDERLEEKEWEAYITEIQEDPDTEVRLGIMSYNNDRELMQKYLMELLVPCGYIQLKLGAKESTQIIFTALLANEAKGRRQCFRAVVEEGLATMNCKKGGEIIEGKLLDISSAGFAVRVSKLYELRQNSQLKGVQLKLHGSLAMADMVFMGPRFDSQYIWILLFDPKSIADNSKLAIHRFIKQCLQASIDAIKV
ncbi:hypothetical protein TREPR_3806 [Treponema primitia ZAS-2]|uniref:PilZ domain-containing protein n=1 Tax=Treponema primitia (strain ATCC BAA-887 / DSM 12427 / ZAS-2) TaxID=545694 RepID=F5YPN7_TREPZ|nr:hypothetical protein [Treponema primitia]AEF86661.1 hypothetical protein TREPR_3806 [Treponema primitia ZAS-2]